MRTISRNGKYLFHATLERNSYVFRPNAEHDNSRQLGTQEIALLSKEKFDNSAELWHLRLGHLNFADMCKLRTRATGVTFLKRGSMFLPNMHYGQDETHTISE